MRCFSSFCCVALHLLPSRMIRMLAGKAGVFGAFMGNRPRSCMVRERITMDVYSGYYDVDVHFVFQNDGPKTTVQMGFPESGGGDIGSKEFRHQTGFLSFHTWVDGRPVLAAVRLPGQCADEGYETYWVKTVPFAAGQSRMV